MHCFSITSWLPLWVSGLTLSQAIQHLDLVPARIIWGSLSLPPVNSPGSLLKMLFPLLRCSLWINSFFPCSPITTACFLRLPSPQSVIPLCVTADRPVNKTLLFPCCRPVPLTNKLVFASSQMRARLRAAVCALWGMWSCLLFPRRRLFD